MLKKLKDFFTPIFQFDLRALALMRIGVGVTLLIDLITRFSNLQAHYSDLGVLPLEALHRLAWNQYYFSFYAVTGSEHILTLLFLLNLICICFLIFGYHTRLSTIICWLFLISIHNRNPYVHQGGDDMLRLLLFWGIFLPWNYFYAFDKVSNTKTNAGTYKIVSLAAFAYMLQVSYVYFFSALLKSSGEWNSEYTAVYYALSLDQMVLPAGKWIYPYKSFLQIITFIVYHIELLAPLLLLSPVFTKRIRLVFIVLIFCMHLGISFCLNVGLFPLIGIVALFGLIPTDVMNIIDSYIRNIRLYDFTKRIISKIPLSRSEMKPAGIYTNVISNLLLIFFIAYVFAWNLISINSINLIDKFEARWVGLFLRVDQHWGMFSPGVFKEDGWYILEASDSLGKQIDILNEGKKVNTSKPAYVSKPFDEDRWRKYSESILYIANSPIRVYYCNYLMRQWNTGAIINREKIKSLRIIYMKESTLPDYKPVNPSREVLCECSYK